MMVSVTLFLRNFMVFNVLDFRGIEFLGFKRFDSRVEVALGDRRKNNRGLHTWLSHGSYLVARVHIWSS